MARLPTTRIMSGWLNTLTTCLALSAGIQGALGKVTWGVEDEEILVKTDDVTEAGELPPLHLTKRAEGDPCTLVIKEGRRALKNKETFIPASVVHKCLTNIPYDSTKGADTVQQLIKFFQLHSAQAFYKDPPTQELAIQPVDLQGQLAVLLNRAQKKDGFASDYDFHKHITDLMSMFNEGHTKYEAYCATWLGYFYHDYSIVSIAKDEKSPPEIYLLDPVTHEIGEKVKSVNGEPIQDHLKRLVHHMIELPWTDPDARYNELMARKAADQFERGAFAQRDVWYEDKFELETDSGNKITVQWKVDISAGKGYAKGFADTDSYRDLVCYPKKNVSVKAKEEPLEESEFPAKPAYQVMQGTNYADRPPMDYWPDSVYRTASSELTVHILKDKKTAVLGIHYFQSFELIDTDEKPNGKEFAEYWVSTLKEIKAGLKSKGIERLIIDVSSNGGGGISIGLLTVRHFFPKSDPFYGFNMRSTELNKLHMTRNDNTKMLELGIMKKVDGTPFDGLNEFFTPVKEHNDWFTQRARWAPSVMIDRELSQVTTEGGKDVKYPFDEMLDEENFLPPQDIIILSNALCASTCATFVEAMSDEGVKSVVFGGRPWGKGSMAAMQPVGGVKGMELLTLSGLIRDISRVEGLKPDEDIMPTPLYHAASVSLTSRNAFAPNSNVPLEFLYQPAEFRVTLTQEMWRDREKLWEAARDTAWDAEGDPREPVFEVDDKPVFHEPAEDDGAGGAGAGTVSKVYTGSKKLAWHILDGLNLPHEGKK